MRNVSRITITAPDVLEAEDGKGKKERKTAEAYFKKVFAKTVGKNDTAPTFTAYKDKTIALALNSLFHGKCAYCESRFVGIHPVDIEHWRPKGDVYMNETTPRNYGYYWLAATWENLLPSCIDCNRVRTHKDFVTNQETTLGKGNYFPLTDENKRTKKHDDEDEESPLLLNPCKDEPSQYLEFHDTGCVAPKAGLDDLQRKKALASIRFYALNRTELVQDRQSRILLIKQKMNTIEKLCEILEQRNPATDIAFVLDELLVSELESLYDFQRPEQPFSSMAKQLIEPFIEKHRPAVLSPGV